MVETFEYTREVLIDEYSLDLEWKNQPALVLKYGEARADAQRDVDIAKEALDLLSAEKDAELRLSMDKVTEKALAAAIDRDSDIQEARHAYITAKHHLARIAAACDAFQQRRAALENLTKLYGMQYFAEPHGDVMDRGKLEEMSRDGANRKVMEAMSGSREERAAAKVRKKERDESLPMRRGK